MSISFESEEIVMNKVRERLRRMTDDELIRFGKDVRRLAENPFQRQGPGWTAVPEQRSQTACGRLTQYQREATLCPLISLVGYQLWCALAAVTPPQSEPGLARPP
jgi:hypothetical protein